MITQQKSQIIKIYRMQTFKVLLCLFIIVQLTVALPQMKQNDQKLQANDSCTEDCCKSLPARGPMTYYYYQNTGRLRGGSGEWAVNTLGYSGQGAGYLNPDYQCVVNTGPLPATVYKLAYCKNTMHDPPVQRPCSFYLEPQKPAEMCGRNDMFIHGCQCCTTGDDSTPPAAGCSAGCVVISYINRKKFRVGDTLIVEHYEPKLAFESQ